MASIYIFSIIQLYLKDNCLKIETMSFGVYKMTKSEADDISSTKTREGEIKECCSKVLRLCGVVEGVLEANAPAYCKCRECMKSISG